MRGHAEEAAVMATGLRAEIADGRSAILLLLQSFEKATFDDSQAQTVEETPSTRDGIGNNTPVLSSLTTALGEAYRERVAKHASELEGTPLTTAHPRASHARKKALCTGSSLRACGARG